MSGKVLVIDDDVEMCSLLQSSLSRRGFLIETFCEAPDALSHMQDFTLPDVVLTDLNMLEISGIEVCSRVASCFPGLPVVIITAFGTMTTAIEAIRAGAFDFVTKPIDMDSLAEVLARAVSRTRLQSTIRRLADSLPKECAVSAIQGESKCIADLRDTLSRVGPANTPVLITGENGTGKRLVARVLHEGRGGDDRGFLPMTCGALPQPLLDINKAHGPTTVFLDEISDIPLHSQPVLLHFLKNLAEKQNKNVRVISVTGRNVDHLLEQGILRSELIFHLNVIHIEVPPLRNRDSDVIFLAQRFLREFSEQFHKKITLISESALERLCSYDWPGNVRELRNVVERAVALARYDQITVDDLPRKIQNAAQEAIRNAVKREDFSPITNVESDYISKVLTAVKGNKSMAAKVLGIYRKTLYRKLERYCISL